MKYKENKSAFYATLIGFALLGILFIVKVVSWNALHIWPIIQIFGLFLVLFFGKKLFLTNKIASAVLLFLFFSMSMDLTNLMPALSFIILMIGHKLFGIGHAIEYENLFQLAPIYFLIITLPFYKGLSLLVNTVLITKKEDIFIEKEKEILSLLPKNTDSKEYDLIIAGDIAYTKATETIIIKARNLEEFIDFTFVLRDKRNSFLGLQKGQHIITSKNCHVSNDGKLLFIEISLKKFFKPAETFIYVLHLDSVNEFFRNKIFQYLRFELPSEETTVAPAMVQEAVTESTLHVEDTATPNNASQLKESKITVLGVPTNSELTEKKDSDIK